MNIRELLKKDFGVDLPIKGGPGNSVDNPVLIEKQEGLNNYVGVEHEYLRLIGLGRKIEWKKIGQELLQHNGRMIDKMKIETKETTPTEIITQIENYYFDISECMKF